MERSGKSALSEAGSAFQLCIWVGMIDYMLPNMYILCVIMYFQRISEHTALDQMFTVETGQNSNEVPSQSFKLPAKGILPLREQCGSGHSL